IRYVDLSSLLPDITTEGFLKETRSGTGATSAVLDLCFSAARDTNRKDRFAISLTVAGGKFLGKGETQEDKLPVSVDLVRNHSGKSLSLEGSITIGNAKLAISSSDNNELTEQEFSENQTKEPEIAATPADFTEASPASLAIRVSRDKLAGLVAALKPEKVK